MCEALIALLTAPFVLFLIFIIAAGVFAAAWYERKHHG